MAFEREEIGNAVLYRGDCLEVMATLEDGCVNAVVTDPPYGIAHETGWSSPWKGQIANDANTAARDAVVEAMGAVPMLIFGSWKQPCPSRTRMKLIWDKGPALGMGALDLPWKPSWEEIYVLGKGFSGRRDGGVIYHPPVQSMAKNGRVHPNEKPVELIKLLLAKCPAGTVIDPFMGSGTTGVASVQEGRKFIGIEVEPKYFDIACRRIEEAQKQMRLFA